MQRTTLSTYPHLIPVKPIEGVVYQATDVIRPHPKMTVMPSDEVQMHQKRESSDMLHENDHRSTIFRWNGNQHPSVPDPRLPIRCSTTTAPATVDARDDHSIQALPNSDTQQPRVTSEKEKRSPFGRLETVLTDVFGAKDSTESTNTLHTKHQKASVSLSNTFLRAGFHCAQGGCRNCSSLAFSMTSTAAPQIEPIFWSSSDFSSEFTTSFSAPSSSDPSEVSPTAIDLDIFQNFNGVHIEHTSPQTGPVCSSFSFIDKLRGTIVFDTVEDSDTDWSSCEDGEEEEVDNIQLTAPDIPCTPQISNSSSSDWYTDTPTPCSREIEIPYDQREWSFDISSTALRVLQNTEDAAQECQMYRI